MGKNVGLTYVKDFTFPAEQGFSGSAGVNKVRGYMRGGSVKKDSMHGKLKREGEKMGYAYGGRVKPSNTSAEFKAKRGKQATMDHGVQPAQKGRNQQEVEAGGNKRLKPGYKKGGEVEVEVVIGNKTTRKSNSGTMTKKEMKRGGGVRRVRMPKNVKAKGGLAKYAAK